MHQELALLTDIPVLIHLFGRHSKVQRAFGTGLPFRLGREDRLGLAAPMDLSFDPSRGESSGIGTFLNALVALADWIASH
jgi:hypothetical protein